MTKHLRHDLERLEKRLLFLGARVEDAVRKAITALLERRSDLAEQVVGGDRAIDTEEVEIEEDCLKILALHQPVATDLRFIAACLKINNDLERIGDLAANIATRASFLIGATPFPVPSALKEMTEVSAQMLRTSLDAFVRADSKAAREVLVSDETVDRDLRAIIEELLEVMKVEPDRVDQALGMISLSKNLERIADHATNIAEDVVYMVEGDIIRHQGEEARLGTSSPSH